MNLKNRILSNYPWIITIILFLAVGFQSGYNIGDEQIKVWDESSGARASVSMLINDNYLIVMDNQMSDTLDTKPPLAMWAKVASYKTFGINEFAVRFPTLLSVLLTALLLILFISVYQKKVWLTNTLLVLMACTPGYMGYHVARHGDPDALLTLFTTAYSIFFFILLDKYPTTRIKYLILATLSLILAYYTKSIAGLAPAAGLGAYTLTRKSGYKLLLDYRLYLAGLSSLIVIIAYYYIRNIYDAGFLEAVYKREFLLLNNYQSTPKHPEWEFYISYLWNIALKPFSYYLPLVLIPLVFGKDKTVKNLIIFSGILCIIYLIGQSSVVIKNEWYIAPIYPFAWILMSSGIYGSSQIILNLIRNKKIKFLVAFVLFTGFVGLSYETYSEIFNRNQNIHGHIYQPEREGHFLRTVKEEFPQAKNMKIISPYASRSTNFYTEKYRYLEGANMELHRTYEMPEINIGDTILACEAETKSLLDSLYITENILSNWYCDLLIISDIRDTIRTE